MTAAVRAIPMPKLGDTVTSGTVSVWLVGEGARIEEGQPLVEIETDKVTTEYPSEFAGVLVEILVREGETVPVGAPIARLEIASGGEAAAAEEPRPAPAAAPPPGPPVPVAQPSRPRPTGAASAAAARAGLDLAAVPGSGPHGRVRLADALAAAAEAGRAAGTAADLVPLTAMRRAIAAHMTESWAAAPHALACTEVEAAGLLELHRGEREAFRERHRAELSVLALLVPAIARALAGDAAASVDVGIAVALEEGLIVPVLRDAARPWEEVAVDLADLIERARAGRLEPDEVHGGQTTVSNVGVFGAEWAQPILNRGQATIFGLAAIATRPRGHANGISWQPVLPVSLVYDASRVDPIAAAAILGRLRAGVEGLGGVLSPGP